MARANLKKVNTSQRLLPQHQRTYPRGPESASLWPTLSMMGFFPINKKVQFKIQWQNFPSLQLALIVKILIKFIEEIESPGNLHILGYF